jgi:hypothetical protein
MHAGGLKSEVAGFWSGRYKPVVEVVESPGDVGAGLARTAGIR